MSDFDERDASDDEPELNEEEVLEQLQELHRQLASRRSAARAAASGTAMFAGRPDTSPRRAVRL